MKKIITFIIIFIIIIFGIVVFTYGKEFLSLLDEKKVYNVENIQEINIDTLEDCRFFNNGLITYNNQKIIFLDYKNNLIWKNEDGTFSDQVYITDNYILRKMKDTMQVLDYNNQKFVMTEIHGNIASVSRENDKIYMIIKNAMGQNSLYVMNDNNEIVVDNKVFYDNITSVSISDKSEGYSLITLRFENGKIINTVYFNLLDDVELWSTEIENEVLIKVKIVNNNVIVLGTKNIYYFNTNGKLMWKNGVYNKILDYEICKNTQHIYILYKCDTNTELISYNLEGKIVRVNKAPIDMEKLKVYEDSVFVYNGNNIYLVHGLKTDKIYENIEGNFSDFIVQGNEMRILSKDKLIKGQIK